MPVLAGRKIPARISAENALVIMLVQTWRFKYRLSRNARIAGVVAQCKAQMVRLAKAIAEIARERAIDEAIVRPLSVGLQIGTGRRVVEVAQATRQPQPPRAPSRNFRLPQKRSLPERASPRDG